MENKRTTGPIWLSPLTLDNEIGIEFRGDHIHVEIGRTFTADPDRRTAFWEKIRRICEEYGSKRVLIEGFAPSRDRDTSDIVASAQQTQIVPDLWMAFHFYDHEPDEGSELFKVVAAAQGIRVKYFANAEDALLWLRRNTPA